MPIQSLARLCCKLARKLRKVYFRPIQVSERIFRMPDSVYSFAG
ncbi:hypothetical protein LINPERHAP1_LOCUS7084 [Linum perenne]